MTTEEKIDKLQASVDALAASVASITKLVNRRVEWEEATTGSGIQLQGLTKVTHQGTLLAITPVMAGPSQLIVAVTVKKDNGDIGVLTGPFKLVD